MTAQATTRQPLRKQCLIAQLSDIHVGGGRYREQLLRTAIREVNAAEPDLVVVAGDLTDDGYPDQYPATCSRSSGNSVWISFSPVTDMCRTSGRWPGCSSSTRAPSPPCAHAASRIRPTT